EVERALQVLIAAFEGDPFTKVLLGGDLSLVPHLLGLNLKTALPTGQVHVVQVGPEIYDIVGVAIWYPPGTSGMSIKEEENSSNKDDFHSTLSEEQRTWWSTYFTPTVGRLSAEGLGPDYARNAWHLHMFGIAPEYQGKGLGKMLFNYVDNMAASQGKSVVLETTTNVNVAIYKHLGCSVCHEIQIENKFRDIRMTFMVKRHGDS
ncbi:hypothetical protein BDQ17DRAFT_1248543, partial [Cyathus striatus]